MGQSVIKNWRKLFSQAVQSGGVGAAIWGTITGTLSDQTDLQIALDAKVDENVAITGATKTKITYDAKGLVTGGADATTADINDSSNRRYVTDAQLTVIQNTSGTNTGDETQSSIITKLALQSGSVNIDFGNNGVLSDNDLVITTVVAPWVTTTTKIVCFVENDGVDHTGEDAQLENIIATAYNIVNGVSFDIIAVAHNLTWGRYVIKYNQIIS